jgi:hypothetical protein
MFTEPLFHKVVDGTKTQTRRIYSGEEIKEVHNENTSVMQLKTVSGKYINSRLKVGDTVFIQEPYRFHECNDFYVKISYKYDNSERDIVWEEIDGMTYEKIDDKIDWIFQRNKKAKSGWLSKMFMPAWCARYFIKITDVRCERVQDISYEDCLKEGITYKGITLEGQGLWDNGIKSDYPNPKQAYAFLFDSIKGKGAWESNPFVWVYDFEWIK